MRVPVLALALVAFLVVAPPASADRVVLNNGSIFDGTIVQESESRVSIKTDMGTMTFEKKQVRKIDRSAAVPPAVEKPPAERPPDRPPADPNPAGAGKKEKPVPPGKEPSTRGSLDQMRAAIRQGGGKVAVAQECLDVLGERPMAEAERRLAQRKILEETKTAFNAVFNRERTAEGGLAVARLLETNRAAYAGDPASWLRDTAESYLTVLQLDEKSSGALEGIKGLVRKHPDLLAEIEQEHALPGGGEKREVKSPSFTARPSDSKCDGRVLLYKVGDLDNEISFAFRQRHEKATSRDAKFRWKAGAATDWSTDALPPPGGGGVEEIWMLRVTINQDYYIETIGPNGIGREDIKDYTWIDLRWDAELSVWTYPTRTMIRDWIAEQLVKAGEPLKAARDKSEAAASKVEGQRGEFDRLYAAIEAAVFNGSRREIMVPLRTLAEATSERMSSLRNRNSRSSDVGMAAVQVEKYTEFYVRYGGTAAEAAAIVQGVWKPGAK